MPYKDPAMKKAHDLLMGKIHRVRHWEAQGFTLLGGSGQKREIMCLECGKISGVTVATIYKHHEGCSKYVEPPYWSRRKKGNMSNNAPLDPDNRNPDLLDVEEALEARHATVSMAVQHFKIALDGLPEHPLNVNVRARMENSLKVLSGEESRLRGQMMRVRMPDA